MTLGTLAVPFASSCATQGWSLANEMLVMGRKLSAEEALAAGLVSRVITADSKEAFLLQVTPPLPRFPPCSSLRFFPTASAFCHLDHPSMRTSRCLGNVSIGGHARFLLDPFSRVLRREVRRMAVSVFIEMLWLSRPERGSTCPPSGGGAALRSWCFQSVAPRESAWVAGTK